MSERYLTIMEVSQKQAYIFQSNRLRDNIVNSAVIAHIMGRDYLREAAEGTGLFDDRKNFVYSGGGHTVLEFLTLEQAVRFTRKITGKIRADYPGIEVFAKTNRYDEGMSPAQNLRELAGALERKKSVRRAAFHQGSFGVEKIDSSTLKPVLFCGPEKKAMPDAEERIDRELMPDGFQRTFRFEELGGTRNTSNFIAVAHIDGNAMGRRVEELRQRFGGLDWEAYKEKQRTFSEAVDADFKAAYREMSECVAENIKSGRLGALQLENQKFPVRRIITAGDDICFVSEGRIGLACAKVLLGRLTDKRNEVDGAGYAACAGVAIVHRKYPFYRAYELAEMLCSNAKRFGARLSGDGTGRDVSAIDWHIAFGEAGDTLEEIRADYTDADGNGISSRPYLVKADGAAALNAHMREFQRLEELVERIQDPGIGMRASLKELRSEYKRGRRAVEYYLKFHRIAELVNDIGGDYPILFDAIELMDTFIRLREQEG